MKDYKFHSLRGLSRALLAVSGSIALLSSVQAQAATPLMPAIPVFRTAQLGPAPDLQLATRLPAVEAQLPVYQIHGAGSAKSLMDGLSNTLGLKGEMVGDGKGKLYIRDLPDQHDQQTLTLFEDSGGFFYRYDHQLYPLVEKQPPLPDEGAAHEIALKYLMERGLLPKDALTEREQVGFSRAVLSEFDGETGKTTREFVTTLEVRFPQSWEGYPVIGPGSKLYVALGAHGKVVGLTHMWREASRTGTYLPTIAPEDALRRLQEDRGRLATPQGCETAKVDRMRVAYWSHTPRLPQRTAVPVYQVSGLCQDAKGRNLGEFEGYAPAVLQQDLHLNTQPREPDLEQDRDE